MSSFNIDWTSLKSNNSATDSSNDSDYAIDFDELHTLDEWLVDDIFRLPNETKIACEMDYENLADDMRNSGSDSNEEDVNETDNDETSTVNIENKIPIMRKIKPITNIRNVRRGQPLDQYMAKQIKIAKKISKHVILLYNHHDIDAFVDFVCGFFSDDFVYYDYCKNTVHPLTGKSNFELKLPLNEIGPVVRSWFEGVPDGVATINGVKVTYKGKQVSILLTMEGTLVKEVEFPEKTITYSHSNLKEEYSGSLGDTTDSSAMAVDNDSIDMPGENPFDHELTVGDDSRGSSASNSDGGPPIGQSFKRKSCMTFVLDKHNKIKSITTTSL